MCSSKTEEFIKAGQYTLHLFIYFLPTFFAIFSFSEDICIDDWKTIVIKVSEMLVHL